ncbi:gamma carbonic anhydrase family protein [Thermomicrobiaceae bacterium CFH 74404]|uniref:Gamma carbonic anhydrase family protein n=1 Tax=Thermalbibacter longus TaxID=2951981 RepID=A0AA42BBP6_9BACT|nr:gamma carbonic anhydrase family protein [Thermalbibacter longus]MCM8749985.1 gamma carbonic anhydrase family protein [Thermalbibacter longus]
MTVYALGERRPQIDPSVYIAEGARVIGDVVLGPGASVWFNAVLRGDTEQILIGEGTNIQDGAVVHADPGYPCVVGARVIAGHGAILHGCQIGDDCLIGMGAIVLNGARLGPGCIVAAGALIPERREIPERSLVMGVPARVVRAVTDAEVEEIRAAAERYRQRAAIYRSTLRQV